MSDDAPAGGRVDGTAAPAREVAAATLASLPLMTWRRLRTLLQAFGGPEEALRAVRSGRSPDTRAAGPDATGTDEVQGDFALGDRPRMRRPVRPVSSRITPELVRVWAEAADPGAVELVLRRRATRVLVDGDDAFPVPAELADRPGVLFAEGVEPTAPRRPTVAVVGTRAATPHGVADARELGAALAEAGVAVASGLAIGIDGAAHEGCLAAGGRAVGVVATGLDVVYPRRHAVLTERVRAGGVLLSEYAFGTGPHARRFPVRNRVLAGLADAVVVVEATVRGGARITADAGLEYGRPVFAVPGSRRNPAAEGCNRLIADGAHPLLDPSDVLVALAVAGGGRGPGVGRAVAPGAPERPALDPDSRRVLRALGGEPATVDELAARTGLEPGAAALGLARLERARAVTRADGLWWPS